MMLCSHPDCQTTVGCRCAERARLNGAAVVDWSRMGEMTIGGPQLGTMHSEDYQRGWDDCLDRVMKVLGENFSRRIR
jgi:hypothetical protein